MEAPLSPEVPLLVEDVICEELMSIQMARELCFPPMPSERQADLTWFPKLKMQNKKIWDMYVNYYSECPWAYILLVRAVREVYGHGRKPQDMFLHVMLKDIAITSQLSKPMIWALYHVLVLPKDITTLTLCY